jgi:hypothetical protein
MNKLLAVSVNRRHTIDYNAPQQLFEKEAERIAA